jgi:hypothetical protein
LLFQNNPHLNVLTWRSGLLRAGFEDTDPDDQHKQERFDTWFQRIHGTVLSMIENQVGEHLRGRAIPLTLADDIHSVLP